MDKNYQLHFSNLTSSLELFTKTLKHCKSTSWATPDWTVKDVLCHIVFWHENYAANYQALAKHTAPPLPEGMSTINMAGVLSLRKFSIKELLNRLNIAHSSLRNSIVERKVPRMTYSKGGRTYETADFLEMITRHIASHTKQLKNAKPTSTSANKSAV